MESGPADSAGIEFVAEAGGNVEQYQEQLENGGRDIVSATEDESPAPDHSDRQPPGRTSNKCCTSFKRRCSTNGGYNLGTYCLLLSSVTVFMFIFSVLYTHFSYNHKPYQSWSLAGGVTSTSAEFRVRGPAKDDGKQRVFVVSTNPNLALERDRILSEPVTYSDYSPEEHFVKRLTLDSLEPLTAYYYGVFRPKITPNSGLVEGEVGAFTTPSLPGNRMNFRIATGSCALTGSRSDIFTEALDLDPMLFVHTGDLHYEDLSNVSIDRRLEAFDKVFGSPTQRLLFRRTIFTYIWDDHDWLANNADGTDVQSGSIAKQSYTLGIPHYPLGSASQDEGNAAKYQAFTIGTVRFIITDLRSESVKSTADFPGRIYSEEQRDWFFGELSQASNYDFVVWVTSRPWTGVDRVGGDGWGGFVEDRDELSSLIADTIGSGPRNLMVISGDNHQVAFDDGSSTDYSYQGNFPGGFPILHSGPLANLGAGGLYMWKNKEHYFTDGCIGTSSDVNYQFSTVDFVFPTGQNGVTEGGCIRIKSYSESNVVFERELCGDIMRFGASEQTMCEMKKMSNANQALLISSASLTGAVGVLTLIALGKKRCFLALAYLSLTVVFVVATFAASAAGSLVFGISAVNLFTTSIVGLAQVLIGALFVCKATYNYKHLSCNQNDVEENNNSSEKIRRDDAGLNSTKDTKEEDHLDDLDSLDRLAMQRMQRPEANDSSENSSIASSGAAVLLGDTNLTEKDKSKAANGDTRTLDEKLRRLSKQKDQDECQESGIEVQYSSIGTSVFPLE